jgi:galactose mutarotase-like enzyme
MIDSGSRPFTRPVYGSPFTSWDMSGWDECFPTINACIGGEHKDIRLPDHGEVWSLPWDCKERDGKIVCSVAGERMPYRFNRELALVDDDTVRLSYAVQNTGSNSLSFLWAAHPQFRIDEPTDILIPESMRDMLCVFGGISRTTGSAFRSPKEWTVETKTTGDGVKFYYSKPVTEAWSGLLGRDTGNFLLLKTVAEQVPYWGVWIDGGMCNDRVTVALEPGIGYYDSLEMAEDNGTAARLRPGESCRWHIDIVLGREDWGTKVG